MDIIVASDTRAAPDPGLECAFCSSPLEHLDIPAREEHYERHLAEDSAQTNRILKPGRRSANYDAFWCRTQPSPPPPKYTPGRHLVLLGVSERFPHHATGLIHLLKKALWNSHAKGATRRAALCYEGSVHVGHEPWDRGWGCG